MIVHLHDHLNDFVLGGVLAQNAKHIANVSTANLRTALNMVITDRLIGSDKITLVKKIL